MCVCVILSVTTAVNIFGVLTMGGRTSPVALAFRQPSNDIFLLFVLLVVESVYGK